MNDTVNKEAIKKWIEALRSGQYKQGIYSLRNHNDDEDDTFCCLGVACDLFAEEVGGEWQRAGDDYKFQIVDNQHYGVSFMPSPMVEYLGLSDGFLNDKLSAMNDGEYSFEQIADEIEKELNNYD